MSHQSFQIHREVFSIFCKIFVSIIADLLVVTESSDHNSCSQSNSWSWSAACWYVWFYLGTCFLVYSWCLTPICSFSRNQQCQRLNSRLCSFSLGAVAFTTDLSGRPHNWWSSSSLIASSDTSRKCCSSEILTLCWRSGWIVITLNYNMK